MSDDAGDLTLDALRTFLDGAHLAAPGDLPEVAAQAAARCGWSARLYVSDYEQQLLIPLPAVSVPDAEPVHIDGTLAGRAFQRVTGVPGAGPGVSLWVPLLDGVHRFGVIQFEMPAGTDLTDLVVQERYRLLGELIGHMVAAKMPYGDALEIRSRRRTRSIAAELLADLLPPLTFGSPGVLISGLLEPVYGVAADAFDYSVIGGVVHMAIFDATGHSLGGTLVAAVAVAAYRNSRRESRTLDEAARTIDDVLREQWDGEMFATGVLAELDLATGRLRYVNAGHPSPLLMRDGRVVKHLEGGRRIVFGLGEGQVHVAEEWLEPGDWTVFYTDGITEARDPYGGFYGVERLSDQLHRTASAGYPVPETLRRLISEVLKYQHGRLQDDATVLIAEWQSTHERDMRAARD